jgi:hypothetical protein
MSCFTISALMLSLVQYCADADCSVSNCYSVSKYRCAQLVALVATTGINMITAAQSCVLLDADSNSATVQVHCSTDMNALAVTAATTAAATGETVQ